jgi:hypothetical protein
MEGTRRGREREEKYLREGARNGQRNDRLHSEGRV